MYGLPPPDGNTPVQLNYLGFASFCSIQQIGRTGSLDMPPQLHLPIPKEPKNRPRRQSNKSSISI